MSALTEVNLARCKSALVIKPSSLGDIVHTLPAVHALKASFPHLQLRWLCNQEWTPLLKGNSDLEEVIPFPRGRFRGLSSFPALIRWIYRLHHSERDLPEVALDFQGLLRSALLGLGRGAELIVGLSDSREGAGHFHGHVVSVTSGDHAVDRYLTLAGALGAKVDRDFVQFPLPVGDAPERALPRDFILLHPFARGRGKSLSEEALQSLCDCLSPTPVVIVGRREAALPATGQHVISLVNETSLSQLIWLARQARACVSVDSGPMHIAAAVSPERTLGIHAWSDPNLVGPYDRRAWIWKAGRIAHRGAFTEAERSSNPKFGVAEARRIADFVLQTWS